VVAAARAGVFGLNIFVSYVVLISATWIIDMVHITRFFGGCVASAGHAVVPRATIEIGAPLWSPALSTVTCPLSEALVVAVECTWVPTGERLRLPQAHSCPTVRVRVVCRWHRHTTRTRTVDDSVVPVSASGVPQIRIGRNGFGSTTTARVVAEVTMSRSKRQ